MPYIIYNVYLCHRKLWVFGENDDFLTKKLKTDLTFPLFVRILSDFEVKLNVKYIKTMDNISDETIERCRCGDKTAFRAVVVAYQRMIFALSVRLLCDEEDAKDIVQETFIRVWLNIGKYDKQQSFKTWIYTIATRLCLDKLRQPVHTEPMPEEEEYFASYLSDDWTDRQLENKELISIIHTLVNQLSDKQRLVFTLIHLENMTSAEAAQVTGFSPEQIKSNLYVARKSIQEKLKKLGYE